MLAKSLCPGGMAPFLIQRIPEKILKGISSFALKKNQTTTNSTNPPVSLLPLDVAQKNLIKNWTNFHFEQEQEDTLGLLSTRAGPAPASLAAGEGCCLQSGLEWPRCTLGAEALACQNHHPEMLWWYRSGPWPSLHKPGVECPLSASSASPTRQLLLLAPENPTPNMRGKGLQLLLKREAVRSMQVCFHALP